MPVTYQNGCHSTSLTGAGFCEEVMHRYLDCYMHKNPVGFYKCSKFIVASCKLCECVGDCQSKMGLTFTVTFAIET